MKAVVCSFNFICKANLCIYKKNKVLKILPTDRIMLIFRGKHYCTKGCGMLALSVLTKTIDVLKAKAIFLELIETKAIVLRNVQCSILWLST